MELFRMVFTKRSIRVLTVLLVGFLLAPGAALSQRRTVQMRKQTLSPQTVLDLQRIQKAAMESNYAYSQVQYLTDNIGPRLSGSPQAQRAVEYVADEMRRVGMEVQLQKLQVPHWVRGDEKGELTEFPGMAPNTKQKLVLTALGGSVATPANGITAEVVVAKSFDELSALGREKVAGKIVVFTERFDQRMAEQGFGGEAYGDSVGYRGAGASAAARLGAVASLIRSVGGAQYRLPHTGSVRYAEDAPKIPAGALAAEDADMIQRLSAQGRVRMHLVLTPTQMPDAPSYNVIADLKGTEHPEQVVIVSGHLDSWDLGTGAIDDAAGVAIAMQTVQLLKRLNLKPKRTIRVVAWMNEENGLVGGRTYAAELASQLSNHFAAIESDRGAGHPLGFEVKGDSGIPELLWQVSDVLREQGAPLFKMVEETEADISPMVARGVPGFGLWQDSRTYFDFHHTPADTLDKVNPRELAENAAAMAVLAYALANMDGTLPRQAPQL